MRYAPPAFDMQFTGPFGINGQASINLPTWMSHPNPQFTVQKVPAHPSDLNHGLQCTPIEVALLPGITVHRFAHLQM